MKDLSQLFRYQELRDPVQVYRDPPGKPIKMIAVLPTNYEEGDYNPLVVFFAVSHARKHDFRRLLGQQTREERLSPYARSLFDSCFKNW